MLQKNEMSAENAERGGGQNGGNGEEKVESRILVRWGLSEEIKTGWELEKVPGTGYTRKAGMGTSLPGRIEHGGEKE